MVLRFVPTVLLGALFFLNGCGAIPMLVQQAVPPTDPALLGNRAQSTAQNPSGEGKDKKSQEEDKSNSGFGFNI